MGLRTAVLYDHEGGGWKEREVFQFLLHTVQNRGHVSPIIMKGYFCAKYRRGSFSGRRDLVMTS